MKQKRLNFRVAPDVNFIGEEGIDAEGLTREFLTALMAAIRCGENSIAMFEGQYPNLLPVHSTDYLSSRMFFYVGQLNEYSVVHGNISLVGVSPAVVSYVINNNINSVCNIMTINDIADITLREILERVCSFPLSLTVHLKTFF